ncbi:TMEM43 family protein [Lacibacterium aquatile]|uniref:TMEM43 family protein n=1 Tax=Lacibacterium aquatile TaxID=1168082 RepID=A0ABW5E1K9_9PROT
MDRFTETTSVSWGGRLKQSLIGMLIGIVLIIACPFGLFWNEGRAVTTAKSLDEGAGAVVSVDAGRVDRANEGRLIHLAGNTDVSDTVADTGFAVTAKALRLYRRVEMYQWKESTESSTRTKLGGGEETVTTYSYEKAWSNESINSADFKEPNGHRNPRMDISGQDFVAKQARLGGFALSRDVLDQLGNWEPLSVPENRLGAMRSAYRGSKPISLTQDGIYLGNSPDEPVIGDYRITWVVVAPGELSVIAKQVGNSFAEYQTAAGDGLLMTAEGIKTADDMFAAARTENTILTWILRGVGLVLLFVGFMLVGGPLAVFADVIPFIGSIVRLGQGLLAFSAALLLGGGTIAVAWFAYRPLLTVAVLAGVAVVIGLFIYAGRRKPAIV